MLTLLRRGLSYRRRCVEISREIDEGKDMTQIARRHGIKRDESDFQIQFEERWWLEKLFDKMHLSYAQGVLMTFGLASVVPKLLFLPAILLSNESIYKLVFGATFVGDMIIIIALFSAHIVQKGLIDLGTSLNEYLKRRKFVSPKTLIPCEGDLLSEHELNTKDRDFQDLYIKPVLGRLLQTGCDLAFNKNYQLGSGAVAVTIFSILMILKYVFNAPLNFFEIWQPVQEIVFSFYIYAFLIIGFLWFLVGMLAWIFFISFLIVIQVSSCTIGSRSYETIKEYFGPATSLTLKTSLALTALVGWFSPYLLLWSTLPPAETSRQGGANLLMSILVVMVPVIFASFLIPILRVHKGLDRSRKRALLIKRSQLEALRKSPPADLDKHLRVQQHLIEDYRSIAQNSEWVLGASQTIQIVIAIVFPIVTFLVSRALEHMLSTAWGAI